MAEEEEDERQEEVRERGCLFRLLVSLVMVALIAGLGSFAWFTFKAQEVSDIDVGAARDLAVLLGEGRASGGEVVITEAELNGYLAGTLDARQAGLLAGTVKLRRVLVRLEEGLAEIVIEREVSGRAHTVSLYLRIEQDAENHNSIRIPLDAGELIEGVPVPVGGRFGQTRIPQGFLRLVLGSFGQLVDVYAAELRQLGLSKDGQTGEPLPHILIRQGKLQIRFPRP
jgi:hypothetical protein